METQPSKRSVTQHRFLRNIAIALVFSSAIPLVISAFVTGDSLATLAGVGLFISGVGLLIHERLGHRTEERGSTRTPP